MVPFPRLYLLSVKSYWQKRICDFDDVTWPTQRSPADNCQRSWSTIAPLSSSTAKWIITINVKGCFDSKTRDMTHLSWSGRDMTLKTRSYLRIQRSQTLEIFRVPQERMEKQLCKKSDLYLQKRSVQLRKTVWGVATTPPPCAGEG